MLACPKVLILLVFTPSFDAANPKPHEDKEPFPTDVQDTVMSRPPQVAQRSHSCAGYVISKNQGCHQEINAEENRMEESRSEDEMKLLTRLRRLKPIQLKDIVKSCTCENSHGCNCQEESSTEKEVNQVQEKYNTEVNVVEEKYNVAEKKYNTASPSEDKMKHAVYMKLFLRLRRLKPIHLQRFVRIAKRTSTAFPSGENTGQLTKKTYTTRLGKREDRPKRKFMWMGKKAYMMRIAKRTSTTVPRSRDDASQVAEKTYTTRLGKRGKEEMKKFRMMGKKAYMMRIGKRSFFSNVSPSLKLLKQMKELLILMSSYKRVRKETKEVL